MKKVVKGILLMSVLTVIYIGAVVAVYANSNDEPDLIYGEALEYEGQPSSWYTPEELGIIEIKEHGGEPSRVDFIALNDPNFWELIRQQRIFKYKDKFYRIGNWGTPALPEGIKRWPVFASFGVALVGGWITVGYFGYRKEGVK